MIPLSPGLCAVTTPTESTVATGVFALDQVKGPTAAVMSFAFGAHEPVLSCGITREEQAWAVNGCACVVDVHPATGSTIMDVIFGCMETETGLLTTPCPVAVIVADPDSGLPAEVPLQTTKAESQTPPQTRPVGETVTSATFDELNVNVAVTGLPAEFVAIAVTCSTSPAFSETEFGETVTEVI
jgi:hypothetical protein